MSNDETSFRHDVPAASETANLPQQDNAGSTRHSLAQDPVGFVGLGHMARQWPPTSPPPGIG